MYLSPWLALIGQRAGRSPAGEAVPVFLVEVHHERVVGGLQAAAQRLLGGTAGEAAAHPGGEALSLLTLVGETIVVTTLAI